MLLLTTKIIKESIRKHLKVLYNIAPILFLLTVFSFFTWAVKNIKVNRDESKNSMGNQTWHKQNKCKVSRKIFHAKRIEFMIVYAYAYVMHFLIYLN